MSAPQVLIAEDDGQLRNILAEMLTDRGVGVMQAVDGMQASQLLKDNAGISLLLSDVKMLRMDDTHWSRKPWYIIRNSGQLISP
jgi:CheY-like chemotaxis protein